MLISFNGSDRSGKSTQVARLQQTMPNAHVIFSVRRYIRELPDSAGDYAVDEFFRSMDAKRAAQVMMDAYSRRDEDVAVATRSFRHVILDRGTINTLADPITILTRAMTLEEAFATAYDSLAGRLLREDVMFYLAVDERTYLERLGVVSFDNLEFQRRLWPILEFVAARFASIRIDGRQPLQVVCEEVDRVISERT